MYIQSLLSVAKLVLPTLGPSTSEVHAGSIKARKEKDEEYNSRDANDNSMDNVLKALK